MNKTLIASVHARRVWDSRGRPTVEAEVTLAGGATGRAIAPAGASRGAREAVDLRDGGERFGGFGVDRALASANGEIADALAGLDACNQFAVDTTIIHLDGSPNGIRLTDAWVSGDKEQYRSPGPEHDARLIEQLISGRLLS